MSWLVEDMTQTAIRGVSAFLLIRRQREYVCTDIKDIMTSSEDDLHHLLASLVKGKPKIVFMLARAGGNASPHLLSIVPIEIKAGAYNDIRYHPIPSKAPTYNPQHAYRPQTKLSKKSLPH